MKIEFIDKLCTRNAQTVSQNYSIMVRLHTPYYMLYAIGYFLILLSIFISAYVPSVIVDDSNCKLWYDIGLRCVHDLQY